MVLHTQLCLICQENTDDRKLSILIQAKALYSTQEYMELLWKHKRIAENKITENISSFPFKLISFVISPPQKFIATVMAENIQIKIKSFVIYIYIYIYIFKRNVSHRGFIFPYHILRYVLFTYVLEKKYFTKKTKKKRSNIFITHEITALPVRLRIRFCISGIEVRLPKKGGALYMTLNCI